MSDPFSDRIAEKALAALREENPETAAAGLRDALESAPERIDLMHALAVTELRLGRAREALTVVQKAQDIAEARRDGTSEMLMPQLMLVRAAAAEDLYDATEAEAAFRMLLVHEPHNPRARQGLGHVLMGAGRAEEGVAELRGYIEDAADEPDYIAGTKAFLDAWRALERDDIHPKEFLAAHRGSYVQFFDHHATAQAEKGWIAEAARMMRDEDGNVVNVIPEGARPYAAVRVDLVDPASGQPGQVGDQPMVVALAGYQPLAEAPVLCRWPERDHPFGVWVSSQCPWDQLPIQVRFFDAGKPEAATALDEVMGDWYTAGFNGAFGTQDRGRLHYISDPEAIGPARLLYLVDFGRAEQTAVTDLLKRLTVLNDRFPIAHVVLGRGYLPAS